MATGAAEAQQPPGERIPWPTPEVVPQGDTVVADSSSLFVYTRPQMERLRARQRNDSLRLHQLARDTASLQGQLMHCRTEVGALEGIVEINSVAIDRLRGTQPSWWEEMAGGLAWFGGGVLVGTAKECVVD